MLAPMIVLAIPLASAFYLPGVAVREYQADERVDIKVNKLTSTKTQLVRRLRKRRSIISRLRAIGRCYGSCVTEVCLASMPDFLALSVLLP